MKTNIVLISFLENRRNLVFYQMGFPVQTNKKIQVKTNNKFRRLHEGHSGIAYAGKRQVMCPDSNKTTNRIPNVPAS